jgi:type IV pilus assembly protein PilB
VEASLTGHLVLSTLHTNNAPSAVIRMVDMGIEPYLIAATVIGVMAQRLARRVCSSCGEEYQAHASELRVLGYEPKERDEMVTLRRGRGCEVCRHTGYKGRTGIHELMVMNDEIAELVVRRAPLADIREAAKANGMKELREDGLDKVMDGATTVDEIRKVVFTAGH